MTIELQSTNLVVVIFKLIFLFTSLLNWNSSSAIEITPKESIKVYFFLLDDCKICRDYGFELAALQDSFGSEQIQFEAVFPNFSSKKNQIEKFKDDFGISFPTKTDYFKKLSLKFDIKALPEVVMYDETNDKILYQGRIDNRYPKIGTRRRVITSFDLKNALIQYLAGEDIKVKKTQAVGCFVNYNDKV